MSHHPFVALWAATLVGGAAAPSFVDLPAERSGLNFSHSFAEDDPRAFLYHSGFACGGVSIGDVNGDDLPDIYFADGAGENALFLNRGDLRFEASQQESLNGGDRWGSGCSFVDIDADGDLDLFQANYDAPLQFFLNDGAGTFTEVNGAFGLAITDAVINASFADADNDGDLDVFLLCNEFERPEGRPSEPPFEMQGGIPVVKKEFEKYFRVSKDRHGEWKMDNYGRADYLFLNEGSRDQPRFRDVSKESGVHQIGNGLSCLWIDRDRDGDLDLYVANDFLVPDRFFRNDGVMDGIPRFTDIVGEWFPSITWSSMGSDSGDVNNDGLQDLLVVDMSPTTHFKSKLNMGEMVGERRQVLENDWPRQAMRNHLFIENGTSIYSESAFASGVASTDWSWAPRFADFDQDGFTDLFVTNGMTRNFTDSDHDNALGDINLAQIGKTKWDLYKDFEPMREANLAFRNLDGRRFEKTAESWGLDLTGLSYNAACGDLDQDGDLDLVVSDLGRRTRIYENRVADGNSLRVELDGVRHNIAGIGAKVTVKDSAGVERTRWMMPASGFQSQNEPMLHFGLGDAHAESVTVCWQEGSAAQTVAVDAGIKRIRIREEASGEAPASHAAPWFEENAASRGLDFTHQEKRFDDFARQPLLPARLSQLGPALAAGDVDGDGDLDLFAGAAVDQKPALFINEGGRFERLDPSPFPLGDQYREDIDALWFDADGDGDHDLYVVSGSVEFDDGDGRYRDRLLINHSENGRVKLEAAEGALPSLADSGSCVSAADYDGDGDLDLFVGTRSVVGKYPLAPSSRLLRNDSNGEEILFTDATQIDAPGLLAAGLVTGAVWSDVDQDGDDDLMLAVEWGPPRLMINERDKLVEDKASSDSTRRPGWWSAVAAADIDGDGDKDFLLGNVGWNTKYGKPHSKKPAMIYYGDMDGSGSMRIVEAKNAENRLLPVRGKSCSTLAMPSLGKKFPSYRAFASVDLPAVYSSERLEEAERFEATCFESGVLINETIKGGSPKFRWVELPWEAQLSQVNDFVVADLDGQAGAEILCAQNHYTREPETGLWRGNPGCVLRWNGEAFEVVPPALTGLFLPNDTKGLVAEDFDGDGSVEIGAAQNNDRLLLYTPLSQDRKAGGKGP